MSKSRLRLQVRRTELVAQIEALRRQLAQESGAIRRKFEVGARLATLVPLLRALIARLRR